jgi:hypothetical protein
MFMFGCRYNADILYAILQNLIVLVVKNWRYCRVYNMNSLHC